MVAALQRGFEGFGDHLGYAVGFMGDDHLPRTVGWDTAYLEALRGMGTGFVYGNDLFQGEAIATQVAMTTDIPLALGYMCPPEFDHLCVDVVWQDWGKAIDKLEYLGEVVVEHMHYLAGKAKVDEGYGAVNNSTVSGHDIAAYNHYNSPEGNFERDVALLKKLIEPKLTATWTNNLGSIEIPAEKAVEATTPTETKRRGRPAKKTSDD
jgi:hypothetical protein